MDLDAIRRLHAEKRDARNPDWPIGYGFWDRDDMAVVLKALKVSEWMYEKQTAELDSATARAAALEKAIIRALKACPFCEAGQCRADAHEWLALALAAALAPAAGET